MELEQIYTPVQADLSRVKDEIKSISQVDFAWLAEQLDYIASGVGKGIRPALTLLVGNLFQYRTARLLPMAVSVELMHTATLVHDDAIDQSPLRRGQPTINALWGEEIAVLMGDYLLARAGEFVADTQTPRAIKLFSHTLAVISSGEIGQFFNAFKAPQSRGQYLARIAGKTASLFTLATESGAILGKAPEKSIRILKDYGNNLGIAFQIVDDILDFTGSEEVFGKPVGSDLIQGTLTLPAMLLMEQHPDDNPVEKWFATRDKSYAQSAIEMVRNPDIIAECYCLAKEYCDRACANLKQLPESPGREALEDLAGYIIDRET